MNVLKSGIIFSKISDHLPCFAIINVKKDRRKLPKLVTINVNNEQAVQSFKDELQNKISAEMFDRNPLSDPNVNYNKLNEILVECKKKHMPTKQVRFNKRKHKATPWITYGIMESIKHKDKLLAKLYATNPNSNCYADREAELTEYCATLQKCKRQAKSLYYKSRFQKCCNNIKETWKNIDEVIKRNGNKSEFPTNFIHEGRIIKEDADIAETFNDFFTNIGPKLASEIKSTCQKSYKAFLTEKITSNFNFHTVDVEHVKKTFGKLKSKASSGHDGISSSLLKDIHIIIAEVTTTIINQSLLTGIFPDSLKCAKVVPVFKKDSPHQLGNYRPISLLPALSKVFEKIAYEQTYEYLSDKKLLYKSQYGFRKNHSTELAAMEVTDTIFKYLDNKKLPIAIFIDLSKAFDTIDHETLLFKLKHYGIRGTAYNWFKSYLTNRTQYVQYKDKCSQKLKITTGVPQGSILGPLLFIVYVNDIAKITNKFHFTIYADDTTLIEPICSFTNPSQANINTLTAQINAELDGVVQWMELNKLSLNVKKTKMMLFHYKQRNVKDIKLQIKINGIVVEKVKKFKFLGITLDENMTWTAHKQKVASKMAYSIGIMKRLKKCMPMSVMKTLYNSLIVPHLTYGLILWGKKLKRIIKLQKWAIRAMANAKYNGHTEPIMKKHGLIKVSDLYKLSAIKIYHKYKNEMLPPFFKNIFETLIQHGYHTRQCKRRRFEPSTIAATQSPKFVVPTIIDSLTDEIKSKFMTHSIKHVTSLAKKKFLESYSNTCNINNCYICNRPY